MSGQGETRKRISLNLVWQRGRSQRSVFSANNWLIVKRRVQCMPGETGAFDPHGKVAHAGKDLQSAKLVRFALFVQAAGHHAMEFIEEKFRFSLVLSFHRLGHHAG